MMFAYRVLCEVLKYIQLITNPSFSIHNPIELKYFEILTGSETPKVFDALARW